MAQDSNFCHNSKITISFSSFSFSSFSFSSFVFLLFFFLLFFFLFVFLLLLLLPPFFFFFFSLSSLLSLSGRVQRHHDGGGHWRDGGGIAQEDRLHARVPPAGPVPHPQHGRGELSGLAGRALPQAQLGQPQRHVHLPQAVVRQQPVSGASFVHIYFTD